LLAASLSGSRFPQSSLRSRQTARRRRCVREGGGSAGLRGPCCPASSPSLVARATASLTRSAHRRCTLQSAARDGSRLSLGRPLIWPAGLRWLRRVICWSGNVRCEHSVQRSSGHNSFHETHRKRSSGNSYTSSQRVRRQGLEPRTRGLREGRLAAQSALPARTAQLSGRNAQNARGT
jgi:hypothetical protein